MARGKKSAAHSPNQETNNIDKLIAENKRLKQELEILAETVIQLKATIEQQPLAEVSTKKGTANLQSDHVAREKQQPAADPRIQAIRSKNQTSREKEREHLSQQSRPSTSTFATTTAARATAAAKEDFQGPKTTDSKNSKTPIKSKPPPINILYQDPKETIELMQNKAAQIKFHVKRISSAKHVLQLQSIADFDEVKDTLNDANTSYYSFTPKDQKNYNYLLKGLPQSFSEEEIANELQALAGENLHFIKVNRFKTPRAEKENRVLPIFIVQLGPKSDLSKLALIKYVNYHVVKWERLTKKGDAQCRRCQRFGHAASNCNMSYRCVKCNEPHKPGECKVNAQQSEQTDFDDYYLNLRPRVDDECDGQTESNVLHKKLPGKLVNCRNIWFREFWSQHHKCSFNANLSAGMTRCTGSEELIDYEQEGLVPFVVDAVYAMAHGVHNLIDEECMNNLGTSHYLCENLRPAPDGQLLLQHIRNVSFIGRQGTEIKFKSDGDAYGFYNVYQYQKNDDGRFDYVLIGSWKEELSLDINMTRWATGAGETHIPRSLCSDNCPLGHVRNFQEACCWSCVACREDSYVFNDTCRSCGPGYAPDETMTRCVKLTAEVIPWTSPWALVPLIFASIGILSTLFTTVVFIRFNRTPVIMASGRELCYVLLVGILSCYGMSFVILSKPTTWNCTYLRIGLGLCLSICYSAILTKTNRISRIFNQETRSIKRPSYTSPKSQVVIAIGITAVQLVGAIVWLIIEPPDTTEIHPYPLSAVLTCRVSTFALMMSLVYNMFLILMCTLYAFKTRKIPENFNEAKYIGFTMYSTCIVWLAFVPIYFGSNNDYKVQIASMCMCINISASVALGCLFTPKVYLVLFQPYKNVRPGHANTGALQSGNRAAYSMRFSGGRSQTMQSMTSCSRSSPPASRQDEVKHANGETQALASPSVEETSVS